MNNIYATHEEVTMLKARALAWEVAGFPDADPRVPALVKVLNQLPFIASVFCCEGHPDRETRPQGTDHKAYFHLAVAATEEGFKIMSALFTLIRDRMMERGPYQRHRVKMLRLCITTRHLPKSPETFPALILQHDLGSLDGKREFFEDLHWALNNVMHFVQR